MNYGRMRNIQFEGNLFNGIKNYVANPIMVQHQQNTASNTWTLDAIDGLPFQGWARTVQSVVMESAITTGNGARSDATPFVLTEIGASKRQVRLNWGQAVKGSVSIYARMDRPQ